MLYGDPDTSALLHDDFVLHWSSERPVPKVTIDFGDGRVVETTITGNAVHLVLDLKGRVCGAIPSLTTPALFRKWLLADRDFANRVSNLDDHGYRAALAVDSQVNVERIWSLPNPQHKQLLADFAATMDARSAGSLTMTKWNSQSALVTELSAPAPSAEDALQVTSGKMATQGGLIRGMNALAARNTPKPAVLHPVVSARILAQLERKGLDASQILDTFKLNLTEDAAKSGSMRWAILTHMGTPEFTGEFDPTLKYIYDKILLTPRDDPWLGLINPAAYNALDD